MLFCCSTTSPLATPAAARQVNVTAPENTERRISGAREAFDQALTVCGVELARAGGRADGAPRRAVGALVRAACEAEMPPERTLAVFKKMLRTLPEVERLPYESRAALTHELVQLAIEAYYPEE